MYDTFAGARPFGLLSGMTNQRPPEIQPTLRSRPDRSGQHMQEQDTDVLSTSSLSLHRQDNDSHSMSASPSARLRYMNVPGLPRANSRISNSDRHSQASGTPVLDSATRRLNIRGSRLQAPVSPHPGFSPSLLLAQDMPNLAERMRR